MIDDEIYGALKAELERAKEKHREATEKFRELCREIQEKPSEYTTDVPIPESSQKIMNAANDESDARKRHLEALIRINEYLLNGTIPAHLKKQPKKETGPGEDKTRKAGSE